MCLCVEGHSQGSHGQGAQASAVPTSWGGLPILNPSLPGVGGVWQGQRFSSEKSGVSPERGGEGGFLGGPWRLRRWGQGRRGTTAVTPCGQQDSRG